MDSLKANPIKAKLSYTIKLNNLTEVEHANIIALDKLCNKTGVEVWAKNELVERYDSKVALGKIPALVE